MKAISTYLPYQSGFPLSESALSESGIEQETTLIQL
jgi:hypothetical protein